MMDILKVKLADLNLASENVRMHPRRQIEEYKRSLEMFGQTKNAVIDEENTVLIGNGLVMSARELGWEEICVIRRIGLSDNEKLKLMVSDNKIWALGVDNLDAIDEVLRKLQSDLDIPGYDEETLRSLVGEAEAIAAEITGYGSLNDDEIASIKNRPEATIKPTGQEVIVSSPVPQGAESRNHTGDGSSADKDGITVKCSKCGELLWLSKDALRQSM